MPSATSAVASGSLPATTIAWKRRSDFPRTRPSASQRLIGRRHVTAPLRNPGARLAGRTRNSLGLGACRVRPENDTVHRNAIAHDGFHVRGLIADANRRGFGLGALLREQRKERNG